MRYEIRNRFDAEIIYAVEAESLKHAVEEAVKRKISLSGADLRGANLSYADLCGANLSGADLRGADLDFSVWPLWCGSLDVKVSARIAWQLLYHFCRLSCQDRTVRMVQKAVAFYANKFHRVKECGEIQADGHKMLIIRKGK